MSTSAWSWPGRAFAAIMRHRRAHPRTSVAACGAVMSLMPCPIQGAVLILAVAGGEVPAAIALAVASVVLSGVGLFSGTWLHARLALATRHGARWALAGVWVLTALWLAWHAWPDHALRICRG